MQPFPKVKMTLDEYLEFDFNAEGRFEYFHGEVFETNGASPEHALLSNRIGRLLGNQLDHRGGLVFSSEVKIKVPRMPPYRYGDITALYGQPIYEKLGNQRLLVNPILIVEVLHRSTEIYDKGEKFRAYKSIENLREYLLVSQSKKFVTLYTKYNEKFWFQSEYVMSETLRLESLNCDLSVDEIYQGIKFEAEK